MHLTNQSANPWFRTSQPKPQARLRLFCFPYAGGAASIYRTWPQHLPADVEVCAVQLPGRENRIQEQPFSDMGELVAALLANLLPYLDKPFALFGHSMGALIAYEVAQALQRAGSPQPSQIFVSGRRAPTLPERDPPLHGQPTDDALLLAIQQRYNNLPAILLQDAELKALYAPLLRADFTLVERYQPSSLAPLACPISAFGGDADPFASEAELQGWHSLIASRFALQLFAGAHFYLQEQSVPLLKRIGEHLCSADERAFIGRAIMQAVDRPGLRQVVLQGQGDLGNDQPIAPTSPFWANLPIPQQDIGKAKELLAAAGYPDGVSVTLVIAEIAPSLVAAAVALQEMVKPAGITIELERVAVDVFWVQYSMQVPFFISYWFNPLDPDQLLSTVYQSTAPFNESGWQSPELDALIEAGRIEPDLAKRTAIYAQAQQLISEQGCVIIPYYRPLLVAATTAVQNLRQELVYSGARDVWLAPA